MDVPPVHGGSKVLGYLAFVAKSPVVEFIWNKVVSKTPVCGQSAAAIVFDVNPEKKTVVHLSMFCHSSIDEKLFEPPCEKNSACSDETLC